MSRGNGRHQQRKPVVVEIDPDSPEGRQLGMSKRTQGVPAPIPGGRRHISNAPALRQQVPVPDSVPEIGSLNAHGVPPGTSTNRERAEMERGPNTVDSPKPEHTAKRDLPQPIPVRVVEDGNRSVYRSAAPHHFTVPPNTGSDVVRLCGRDAGRSRVLLMNESPTGDIRFAQRIADLNAGGGALLSHLNNNYLALTTQDDLYALSADGSSPTISVIQEFEQSW